MTEAEIDFFITQLDAYRNFVLTNLLYDETALQISLSSPGEFVWITFSLKPGFPFCFIGDQKTPTVKGLKKPLSTFGLSHVKGEALAEASRVRELGRVVRLQFTNNKLIDVVLFRGGQNVKIQSDKKTVFAYKPKELLTRDNATDSDNARVVAENQDYLQIWQRRFEKKSAKPRDTGKDELAKQIKKKQSGLEKMKEKRAELAREHWREAGEWLKKQQSFANLPEEMKRYLNTTESLSWNIENCFNRAKKNLEKVAGTDERIGVLEAELDQLAKGKVPGRGSKKASLLHEASAQGRTRELSSGQRLYVGRSAKDNLALLRRAKPWFIWLHIRYYPGAYGIIERERKDGVPSQAVLTEAGREIVKQSVKGLGEGVFEVIFAECRYVRPIPKMKAGQVTYSHEKVIRIRL